MKNKNTFLKGKLCKRMYFIILDRMYLSDFIMNCNIFYIYKKNKIIIKI